MPQFGHLPGTLVGQDHVNANPERTSGCEERVFEGSSTKPKQFNYEVHCGLARNLNLLKDASEILASTLNDKNCLGEGTKVTFYRTTEKELFFTV